MEKLVESGKTRSIGVSNFNIANLDKLLKNCKIPPAVNQVRFHRKMGLSLSLLITFYIIGRNASLFITA